MSQAAWRKWHRWVGFAAAPFLLFAALTGIAAGVAEMTSEDEEAREKARERVSEVKLPAAGGTATDPVAKALAAAATRAPAAPVDKVTVDFKAVPPTTTVFLGKPAGGEDKKLVFHAETGELLREERYEDKPFLTRLHSGEAFGDWGLVFGTAWGAGLVVVTLTGLAIYFAMRKPDRKGLARVFW
ncbi:PepSY domain-containing protein [Gemmata sp. JC673]|uniref:PepSY domain-containing protein n=1 Tax=Gemmata algarum TaxID=2975278 RepID=A0ABU5EWM6_9BACT|nr:PepSY domain-containing protein [Gemmata algarum]MDY3559645.1 PepSY domain-containing protein [Gemmata algarum]